MNFCTKVNYIQILSTWLTNRKLELSPGKSSATLFTTWTKEVNIELDIAINGQKIPTSKNY